MGTKVFEPINAKPTRAELVARAEYVGKLAESEAMEADRNARVSDRVVQAIQETELNKLLRPKRYGGPGVDLWTYKEVLRKVTSHSVAAGWLTFFYALHEFWVAYMPPEGREEIYNSGGMVADVFAPNGRIEQAGDGEYVLSGRWGFASGILHSNWMGCGAMMHLPDSEKPELCLLTVPKSDFKIIENWDCLGIRGSGSHDVVVEGARVPLHRIFPLDRVSAESKPIGGDYDEDDPMYSLPFRPFFSFGFSLLVLGCADRLVSLYQEKTEKRVRLLKGGIHEKNSSSSQRMMAELQMMLLELEGLVDSYIRKLEIKQAEGSTVMTNEEKAQMNAMRGRIAKNGADIAVKVLMNLGASAALKGNPVEMFTRDMLTLVTHFTHQYEESLADYGALIFS